MSPPASGGDQTRIGYRLQVLSTEHMSLLATRTLTWNEIFTRSSMFLSALSGALVALALVAQATALGAALAIHAHWNKNPLPADIIQLKHYAVKNTLVL